MSDFAQFVGEMESFFTLISRHEVAASSDCNLAEFLLRRGTIYRRATSTFLSRADDVLSAQPNVTRHEQLLLDDLETLLRLLNDILRRLSSMPSLQQPGERSSEPFRPPTVCSTSGRGRPAVLIRRDQLETLWLMGYSWTQIAAFFGVSVRTIYNRRQELAIQDFSGISDNDLDALVSSIIAINDRVGESMVMGALRARDIRVQYRRVRQSLIRVDLVGRALRRRQVHFRRIYRVPAANSLW